MSAGKYSWRPNHQTPPDFHTQIPSSGPWFRWNLVSHGNFQRALLWPRIPRFQNQFPHLLSGEGQVLSTEVPDRGLQGNLESHGSTGTTGGTSKPQFPPLGCSGTFYYRAKSDVPGGASSTWNLGLSMIACPKPMSFCCEQF